MYHTPHCHANLEIWNYKGVKGFKNVSLSNPPFCLKVSTIFLGRTPETPVVPATLMYGPHRLLPQHAPSHLLHPLNTVVCIAHYKKMCLFICLRLSYILQSGHKQHCASSHFTIDSLLHLIKYKTDNNFWTLHFLAPSRISFTFIGATIPCTLTKACKPLNFGVWGNVSWIFIANHRLYVYWISINKGKR